MALTPLERKAAFMHAVTMRQKGKMAGAREIGYSWTHVETVLNEGRAGSEKMKQRVAEYCGVPYKKFWGEALRPERVSA